MFVIRWVLTGEYINEAGEMTPDINEAFRFENKEQATRYAIHAHLMAPEYVEV